MCNIFSRTIKLFYIATACQKVSTRCFILKDAGHDSNDVSNMPSNMPQSTYIFICNNVQSQVFQQSFEETKLACHTWFITTHHKSDLCNEYIVQKANSYNCTFHIVNILEIQHENIILRGQNLVYLSLLQ